MQGGIMTDIYTHPASMLSAPEQALIRHVRAMHPFGFEVLMHQAECFAALATKPKPPDNVLRLPVKGRPRKRQRARKA
jgi:hypothetical protein